MCERVCERVCERAAVEPIAAPNPALLVSTRVGNTLELLEELLAPTPPAAPPAPEDGLGVLKNPSMTLLCFSNNAASFNSFSVGCLFFSSFSLSFSACFSFLSNAAFSSFFNRSTSFFAFSSTSDALFLSISLRLSFAFITSSCALDAASSNRDISASPSAPPLLLPSCSTTFPSAFISLPYRARTVLAVPLSVRLLVEKWTLL